MPFLQNTLSDHFLKARQGRLTMGSPTAKRANQFSSPRPWFIHTVQVKQISGCWFSLFLECVSVQHTDLFPVPSLPVCGVATPLSLLLVPLPWISSLPFTPFFFFLFKLSRSLTFFPPILLREGFCSLSFRTAACNPAAGVAISCLFSSTLDTH